MSFLSAEEEEMLQDAYNTIKSIDSHLAEIQKTVVPEDEQKTVETPPADEEITEKPVEIPKTETLQEVIDYTEQLKQISDDLQMQVKVSIILVLGVGIVAGLMAGKIMWGEMHAG